MKPFPLLPPYSIQYWSYIKNIHRICVFLLVPFLKKTYKSLNDSILMFKLPALRGLKIEIKSNFHMGSQKTIKLDKTTNETTVYSCAEERLD